MRTLLMGLTLVVVGASASAQDPGMQATQAAQQAAQISMQAAQQATDQAMRDAQMASQNAMSAQQQAAMNASASSPCCYTGTPKFSVKPGAYSSPITVKMHAGYGAVIYYTTDGWTPTTASKRYRGPITIDSTTTLQAIAVSRYGGRSRLAIAAYTLAGASPAPSVAQSATADFALNSAPDSASNSAAAAPESGKLLLAQGTPVPLVFASDVSSKTADVGDKISLTLGEDLKAGNVVVVKKGTPTVATVTEVDKPRMMGVPGAVYFEVDSLKAGDAVIKLHGGEAKEGQDQAKKAMALIAVPVVPVALFVHGKDAEIKQGATFTAFVDVDALLPPAN